MVGKWQIIIHISSRLVAMFGGNLQAKRLDAAMRALYSLSFLGLDISVRTLSSVARDYAGYTNSTYSKGIACINIHNLVRGVLIGCP